MGSVESKEDVTRVSLVALLALLVAPSVGPGNAAPGGVTIVSRDLPVGGERTLASTRAPSRFDLVGLRWRGRGTVVFRTRSTAGRWSVWQAPDDDESDAGPAPPTGSQYRARGHVSRLRAYYIWSPVEHQALRRLSVAGSPPIVSRAAWGGDELLRRNQPRYASAVRLVIVHHTATPNDYTPDQAAAIVRGIDVYHVKANGWNDIGYNFLVDRFGHVYEGRYGGITRNVIGAHALGFNTGSVGIALIGNFMTAKPTPAADAVARAADRLAARPRSRRSGRRRSRTSRAAASASVPGRRCTLRAVSGHRDTGLTSCPGNAALRAARPDRAGRAEQIGLPKLYAPVVRGKIGGPVAFSARLSSALPWTITVIGPDGRDGRPRLRGRPVGRVDLELAPGSPRAGTRGRSRPGSNVLPARGVIGGASLPPPPRAALVQGLAVSPAVALAERRRLRRQGTVAYTLVARRR